MKRMLHISGAVLPTVLVVSVLLAIMVAALVSLWEADFLFFSKHRHDAMQRAHIVSAFTLYREYPEEVISQAGADGAILLYDSVPHSRVTIKRRPWGLYEVVTVSGCDGKTGSSKILGKRQAGREDAVFYYKNNNSALTLAGKTNFRGRTMMPRNGVVYGQMGSVFFNGEKLAAGQISVSGRELPGPEEAALSAIAGLRDVARSQADALTQDSVRNRFRNMETLVFAADELPGGCYLSGNIIITGADIYIDSSCRLYDVIAVGDNIRIGEGFRGSLQAFAADSLHIENDVTLEYPSGAYSETYIGIGEGSVVNGYAIVDPREKPDARNANYRQSRLATVRGLVYVSGTAQLQGIVSGAAYLDRAVYYSPRGYYENMLYDITILGNAEMAWPFWLAGPSRRKEAKWAD